MFKTLELMSKLQRCWYSSAVTSKPCTSSVVHIGVFEKLLMARAVTCCMQFHGKTLHDRLTRFSGPAELTKLSPD